MKKKGFTLIELLVVIAIIALLMAILMPALAKVREQALLIVCKSNMRQWALIFYMYTQDNEGFFPEADGTGEDSFFGVITPYVQDDGIRLCPRAMKTFKEGDRPPRNANVITAQGREFKGSYGMNDYVLKHVLGQEWDEYLWKTINVKNPERVPVYAGCQRQVSVTPGSHDCEPPVYEGDVIAFSGPAEGELKNFCVNRHNGYICGVLMDFSARKIGLKELWELKWTRTWNENNDPPPVWPYWMKDFKEYYRF